MRWLARRDYSQYEITQKLKMKGYDLSEIEEVITDFVQAGYINDGRFAENYISWRRKKGFGPLHITLELEARGISKAVIADLLEITDNAWFAEAHKVWLKHFKGHFPEDFKTRAKQMRFLQYRGFTQEQIEGVFDLATTTIL